jgi:Holliday junction resolvasome RuvABC endonuclease subunit
LKEVIEAEEIEMIVHERVAGRHQGSLIVAGGLVGVIHLVCEDLGLEYACYSAGEIKKFATGKGNAKKEAMIEAAKKYKEDIVDDNEADAILLYHMVKEELG